MTEEAHFLQAILDFPEDQNLRLVYADWLEERGDPRAEQLRLMLQLASMPQNAPEANIVRKQMMTRRTQIDERWLAIFDQPALLLASPVPFQSTWASVDLEGFRQGRGTYTRYPYKSLPPLPIHEFQGDFEWLRSRGQSFGDVDVIYPPNEPSQQSYQEMKTNLEGLVESASQHGLNLPQSFLYFFRHGDLLTRIPTVTACFFCLPAQFQLCPQESEGFLISFLIDSQGVCFWHLYLNRQGYHCVLTSWNDPWEGLGEENLIPPEWPPGSLQNFREGQNPLFCAPTFESFLYRFWIENRIFFALSWDGRPLTQEEEKYVHHYGPQKPVPRRRRPPDNTGYYGGADNIPF